MGIRFNENTFEYLDENKLKYFSVIEVEKNSIASKAKVKPYYELKRINGVEVFVLEAKAKQISNEYHKLYDLMNKVEKLPYYDISKEEIKEKYNQLELNETCVLHLKVVWKGCYSDIYYCFGELLQSGTILTFESPNGKKTVEVIIP